jgi:ADP-heptose:LPS heptosyltransferase
MLKEIRSGLWPLQMRCEAYAMRLFDAPSMWLAKPHVRDDMAVIKLDAIGDFILWLDAAKELKRIYPNRRITLVGNAIWRDIACRLPYWDEVLPIDVVKLRRFGQYRASLMRALRRRGFSLVIQPTFSRRFLTGDSLVRATHARERIGSQGDLSNITAADKRISDRWYTSLVPANPLPMMELERNAEFLRGLGHDGFQASIPVLPVLRELSDTLRVPKPYFVVFPGASAVSKQWRPEYFSSAASEVARLASLTAVVCGSDAEKSLCGRVASGVRSEVLDLSGKTSLSELVEILRGACILLTNDTSAVHIAAAVGTPSVCVLGGGHYGRFVPYTGAKGTAPSTVARSMHCFGCNWKCTQPHVKGEPFPCIDNIPVADVLRVAESILGKYRGERHVADSRVAYVSP